ncbi:STAS domain-containing protein [Dyella mobilis]|uniref:STAS domain-containing protein n=1 Tax=Dyella mobilis TaxID=1849582 RepID=A0ABS2K9Q7_9GAMM|nr:STAS domain-containing protein [Dyella mobilis]MBM7127926.1 STAS domain-containing protein [Dyella mobilis]
MGSKSKGGASKGEVRVGMPADFRIAEVTDVHRQLGEALDASQILLDGGAVDRIDTAALQMLVVFQREAQKRGNTVNWAGASAPLHDAASQLGLAQILALPAKQPA